MIDRTIENNYKFLSDKRNDLLSLYRLSCREAISLFSENAVSKPDPDDASRVYQEFCGKNNIITPSMDLAVFCSEFSKKFQYSYGDFIDDSESDGSEDEHSHIAYLKNAFSDKAFRKFSDRLDRASAVYFAGFREVCEEVYYGRSSYAILPVFSSTDGQLSSFRQLISKYDLNIISAVDIEMSDETFMRYALLKKGLSDPLNRDSISYFDFTVVTDGGFRCGEFLAACEFLGATMLNAYSYPSEYSESSSLLYLVFDISSADLAALYLLFECSHIRYTPVGAYNVL